MEDQRRTKAQLIEELERLRRRVREIEGCADPSRSCLPREILEATEDGIWVVDASDKLIYVNPGMGSLAGAPPASFLGLSVTRDFPEETTGRFLPHYREAKRTLRPVAYQVPVVTPAGRETVQAGWLTPRIKDGRFDGMVGTIRDVTDREAVANELRTIFEMSLDMICVADIHTATFLKVNPALMKTLGHSEAELLGRPFLDFVHPDDVQPTLDVIREKLQRNSPVISFRNRYRCRGGNYRWLSWTSRPVAEKGITYAVAHDVTEHRESEAALRENAARLELATTASKIGLWDWDLRSNRIYFSPLWKAQLGYENHEIESRVEEWRDRLHPDDRERALTAVEGYIAGEREDYEIEFRLRHKDGSYRWIYTRADKQLDASGKAVRVYGCHVDITERKRSEESLEEQRGQLMALLADAELAALEREQLEQQLLLAQKMEAIGTLAGGVAHDFNNLLQAMLGYALLLGERLPAGSGAASDLAEIEKGCRRATALTRQLLALGRRQVMQTTQLELTGVVTGVVGMLRHMIGEDVELILLPAQDPVPVTADRGQIEQVLMNLAVNARDAMPEGGRLTVSTFRRSCDEADCRRHPDLAPGEYGVVAVQDTGVGMNAETLCRVFEPFFTTKEPGHGTGLGLSTAYGIARQHGGTVVVTSEEGRGATFEVLLPAADGVAAPDTEADRESFADLRGSGTILVAEDDESVRRLLSQNLTDAGYTVVAVGDGQAAVKEAQVRGAAIELLILDAVMPTLSGRQAQEQIAAMHGGLPTIFITGYPAGELDGSETADGRSALLMKPFSRRQLLQAVRHALRDGEPVSASPAGSRRPAAGSPRDERPAE